MYRDNPNAFQDFDISEKVKKRCLSTLSGPSPSHQLQLQSQSQSQDTSSPMTSVKPLLNFETPNYKEPNSNVKKKKTTLRIDGNTKSTRRKRRMKPLIDISDSKNCRTCGCSDFKTYFSGDRRNICGYCLHDHMKSGI